jgi:hypothetical protein
VSYATGHNSFTCQYLLLSPHEPNREHRFLQFFYFNMRIRCRGKSESESYVTTDGQSASLSWNKEPIWCLQIYFITVSHLRVCWCGAFSLKKRRSVVWNCLWFSPAQSFSGPSPLGLVTIFYCLRIETSLSSPPMTRNTTVEIFDPASTRDCP